MSIENCRLFIGNVHYHVSSTYLQETLSKAGTITKLELFTDDLGYSRGCGIVHFSTRPEALRAIEMFHHTEICNRLITVKEDDTFYLHLNRPVQIIVKKMPMTVTWQQLKDVCREIGCVLRADVKIQIDGTSTGTVLFENCSDAIKAVKLLNGALFNKMKVEACIDSTN